MCLALAQKHEGPLVKNIKTTIAEQKQLRMPTMISIFNLTVGDVDDHTVDCFRYRNRNYALLQSSSTSPEKKTKPFVWKPVRTGGGHGQRPHGGLLQVS